VAIELVRITPENHKVIRALAVRPDQTHLVAGVDASLADAYVWPDAMFRAAFEDGQPVGYVMVYPFDRDGIPILRETIDWISDFSPRPDALRISTLPENAPALGLYLSMGFEIRGTEESEVALYRQPAP
jgi:hypothetical protein